MAYLVTLKGPDTGRQFLLEQDVMVLGRQTDSGICLESQAVSRHHARILRVDSNFFVEDMGSSNGTYVNGARIRDRVPLTEKDTLQIGPYIFGLRVPPAPVVADEGLVIRSQISASGSDLSLFVQDPARKLEVVLEIAQSLSRTLDLDVLLTKLLDHLMILFPQADQGIVLLCEGDRLVVRAQHNRRADDPTAVTYSRTVVKKALEDGVGILSEDVHADERFIPSATLTALGLRSLICVPLISQDGQRLGVLQLDRFRSGKSFSPEDLQLLTTIGLQVKVVLENASLHAELIREERLRQELALAREIQQGFLPTEFPEPDKVGYELFARVSPAREVSGDFYDFWQLDDGRLVFIVGDVSGKGMPAALFMVMVRTLCRHLGTAGDAPAPTLARLNKALSADNPSSMFVTLLYGIYDPKKGEAVLASAGHPPPILRPGEGDAELVELKRGPLLGVDMGKVEWSETRVPLASGETLALYTDGFIEARDPASKQMFEVLRLQDALSGPRARQSLEAAADQAKLAVERFIASQELQDDLTLLLLRKV
ncbi:MAG TPA: SpoIIE family protein phosphatase [Gemmataceae bacterium]|jgi:serine phosphatase RsbU (regulator of sigma subunit)|nr:SpoIIE family protein phosphatase [Gemmataceae bacterium]